VQHFSYARLEEAVFYQYAYGESNSLFPQAARFVSGFLKMRPFEAGNEATALVSFLAFLSINGYTTDRTGDELAAWLAKVTASVSANGDLIAEIAKPDPDPHHGLAPDVRSAVRGVLDRHSETVARLFGAAAA